MVPFRQASQSPDHEKPMALSFRSSYDPVMTSINKNTRDSETYGQPPRSVGRPARTIGRLRVEGKNYIVQDGDILEIRFNI